MRRNSMIVFLVTLFVTLCLPAVASAAGFNLTIRLEEDTVGFTELGWKASDRWDVVLGFNYTAVHEQTDDGLIGEIATAVTVGGRYYLKKANPFDVFLWGNVGIIPRIDISDGEREAFYSWSRRIGLGLAHNLTNNWAVVAVTGCRWITMKVDGYDATDTRTFNSLGVRFSW